MTQMANSSESNYHRTSAPQLDWGFRCQSSAFNSGAQAEFDASHDYANSLHSNIAISANSAIQI
ncbi:hypothetical protein MB901379_01908 [Mycobacterium basiliense]|uniref:Uncharacterized protein n=1 Tax=Mycobacterium basiliense TaxID=2094119 RepID=A0A447GCW3_9MYCO|nr:hypothetical protein MB901379_01908 [Mycobacterium basiliense]